MRLSRASWTSLASKLGFRRQGLARRPRSRRPLTLQHLESRTVMTAGLTVYSELPEYDESNGFAMFWLELDTSSNETITVQYETFDGVGAAELDDQLDGAVKVADYEHKTGTVTFLPGELIQAVSVTLVDDVFAEDVETFDLQLSNLSAGAYFKEAYPGDPSPESRSNLHPR